MDSPDSLFMAKNDEKAARYYAECDAEHRRNGFTGPSGYCPALIAEDLRRQAEYALLLAASDLLGAEFTECYGDSRKKAVDLLLGACLADHRKAA